MMIQRDGHYYELTPTELEAAYREQQHLNDISDVHSVSEYYSLDDWDDDSEYAFLHELVGDDAKVRQLAERWREAEDDRYCSEDWQARMMDVVRDMIEEER